MQTRFKEKCQSHSVALADLNYNNVERSFAFLQSQGCITSCQSTSLNSSLKAAASPEFTGAVHSAAFLQWKSPSVKWEAPGRQHLPFSSSATWHEEKQISAQMRENSILCIFVQSNSDTEEKGGVFSQAGGRTLSFGYNGSWGTLSAARCLI